MSISPLNDQPGSKRGTLTEFTREITTIEFVAIISALCLS